MNEIWKDVFGLEEYAMVSNLGRVRTKDRYVNNNGGMFLLKGKERKAYSNGLGYMQLTFKINNNVIRKYVHVMVLESFYNRPSELHEVNHIDHDKSNNNLDNLEWVTKSDNIKKMINFHGIRKDKKYYCEDCGSERSKTSKSRCKECHDKYVSDNKLKIDKYELLSKIIKNEGNIAKTSREYGLSDNGLREKCISNNIPSKSIYYKKLLKYLTK